MDELLSLKLKAKYSVGEPVYWRGAVYYIKARYYRRSLGWIVYDLEEEHKEGESFRFQRKRREVEIEPFTFTNRRE